MSDLVLLILLYTVAVASSDYDKKQDQLKKEKYAEMTMEEIGFNPVKKPESCNERMSIAEIFFDKESKGNSPVLPRCETPNCSREVTPNDKK
jgi:hypothetical protein